MKSKTKYSLLLVICLLLGSKSSYSQQGNSDTSDFVTVKNGHLSVNGERQRYWAAVGKVYANANIKPEDSPEQKQKKIEQAHKSTAIILDRLEIMGFNSVRFWDGFMNVSYTKGDGSTADCADYFIAEAKKRGFKIWSAGMNRNGSAKPEDVTVINDLASAESWRKAVAEMVSKNSNANAGWELRNNPAVFWDARLEALSTTNKQKVVNHFNQYTGLRWCDDPVFGIWELSNEEWWMRRMLSGAWQKLPDFFQQSLLEKWHQYLLKKYKTQKALKKAWGKLLPGEKLKSKSILFAPMAIATKTDVTLNDANAAAIAAVQAKQQSYKSEDFTSQRGSDVLEFLVNMQLSYKERQAEAIKKMGRSTTLCPMVYDTGIGYEIQSQYLHQNADAVAHDAYVNGYGPTYEEEYKKVENTSNPLEKNRLTLEAERIASNDGPWVNWLLKPPGISQGVPWLEQNKVEGKPYLVYETQIQQPAKYRADFPLRLAALASIQDWDWITFHYFGDNSLDNVATTENPFEKKLDVTTGRHPQGYHLTYDEVQTSLMRAASYIFKNNAWKPALNPTTFIYGRKSLYDPQSMNYGHSYGQSGMNMLQTVYQYGSRIKIDPTRQDDQVIGPVVTFDQRNKHTLYNPTDELVFDWKEGYFKANSSNAVAFAGGIKRGDNLKLGEITISEIEVNNPKGIFAPIDPENPWFAVSVYTLDGKTFAESKQSGISIASTSFNTGYAIGEHKDNKISGTEGTLPVLVARIGAKFQIPVYAGANYTMFDFNNKIIAKGKLSNSGELTLNSEQAVWYIELNKN